MENFTPVSTVAYTIVCTPKMAGSNSALHCGSAWRVCRRKNRLQTDLDKLTEWAIAWDMQFHPAKCLVMNISKKRHPSKFTYSLHSTDLKMTDTAKYLGITISQDMKWTKHITQTCSRANRALGFIKRNVKVRSLALRRSYTIALFARTSNMLQLYGPLMR